MDRVQLKAIAKRRGMIRWRKSGVYECLEVREKVVIASGPVTKAHILIGDHFDCVEVDPKSLVSVGDLFYPRGPVPYSLVNETRKQLRDHERKCREKRHQKWCAKVVRQVLDS